MSLQVTAAATGEPVARDEMKAHLRVASTAQDAVIDSLITSTRTWMERQTRRSVMDQTFRLTLDEFPREEGVELPRAPLTSSTSVSLTYLTTTGAPARTFSSTRFIVASGGDHDFARIVLREDEDWPTVDLQAADGVRVDFDAGYGGSGDVPDLFLHGMKLVAGHWFEHREGVTVSGSVEEMPMAVRSIVWHFRLVDVP